MTDLADLLLGLAIGVGITSACWLHATRPVQPAAARPVLSRLDPTNEWTGLPDLPLLDWLPVPAAAEHLAAWDAELEGLPWGTAMDQRPVQVRTEVDELGATVHRIVPERPSTAMIRALVGAA